MIGVSNDLKFTEFLDPRVKSSLGEEELIFPPYDAEQISDILKQRAKMAYTDGSLGEMVIPLCAAFAAQEHGDARRALDLLRVSGEIAERENQPQVLEEHVRRAQEKIEVDRVVEVVRTFQRSPNSYSIVSFFCGAGAEKVRMSQQARCIMFIVSSVTILMWISLPSAGYRSHVRT